MSFRFNKNSFTDFGLISTDSQGVYANPVNHTLWKARQLYDYGWGKENGYYKMPMPGFNELVDIILFSKNEEDKYGAASVILDDFGDELLDKCVEIFDIKKDLNLYADFFKILQLQKPFSRSSTIGKNASCISADYSKWKLIAEQVSDYLAH